MPVQFFSLKAVNSRYREELLSAAARAIDTGWYVHGAEHAAFEKEFAAFCGAGECVGVASGLDALILILRACKEQGRLAEGDEVIVPANNAEGVRKKSVQ